VGSCAGSLGLDCSTASPRPGPNADATPSSAGPSSRSARPPRPIPQHRRATARARDRQARPQARSAATRSTRCRHAPCRADPARLVASRPSCQRGRLCQARRRRPDPGFIRPNGPLPPRSQRRPQAQPSTPPDPAHKETNTCTDDRLHRAPNQRRQNPPGSNPLPQALPRPQPLPPTGEPAPADLTNIEASLAQATF
jgi:hypothetical protein